MEGKPSEQPCLSIGAVSQATGIPAATLRTWERRYGFPDPSRTDAGHRRYAPTVVGRLRLISRALDDGYRPSDVVGMAPDALEGLLETAFSETEAAPSDEAETDAEETPDEKTTGEIRPVEPNRPPEEPVKTSSGADATAMGGDWLDDWMQAVTDLDGNALHAGLRTSWNRLGGLAFLEKRIGPFLARIGHAWRRDKIGIVHEHYTSEQLQDFLSARWRPLSERSAGPTAICATLPGEDHVIGLHIAALVLAMADWQIVFLGGRTPVAEIVEAAGMDRVDAVVISFSERFGLEHARRSLTELRDSISDDIDLLAGGSGAPTDLPDTPSFSTLEPFYRWALERAQSRK